MSFSLPYYFSAFRKEINCFIDMLHLNLFIEVEVNCLFMTTFEKNSAEIFYDTDRSKVLFFQEGLLLSVLEFSLKSIPFLSFPFSFFLAQS